MKPCMNNMCVFNDPVMGQYDGSNCARDTTIKMKKSCLKYTPTRPESVWEKRWNLVIKYFGSQNRYMQAIEREIKNDQENK